MRDPTQWRAVADFRECAKGIQGNVSRIETGSFRSWRYRPVWARASPRNSGLVDADGIFADLGFMQVGVGPTGLAGVLHRGFPCQVDDRSQRVRRLIELLGMSPNTLQRMGFGCSADIINWHCQVGERRS